MTDTSLPEDNALAEDEALAGEYVLGALDLVERSAVQARLKTDVRFASLVADWQNRLSGLNDDYAEAVAPNLLPQLEARLFPVAAKPARPWFGWLAAGAFAVAAVVALVFVAPQTAPPGVLVATLAADPAVDASGLIYEARYSDATLTIIRTAGNPAPAGSVHQLWIIAPNAAPVPLGLLDGAALALAYPTAPPPGWTLAVSVEPTGGSPTGAPTGPVILATEIKA